MRIKMTGTNASGSEKYLSLSGFELYGTIVDVVESDDFLTRIIKEEAEVHMERERARQLRQMVTTGVRVARGPDWKWGKQDGDPPSACCAYPSIHSVS